MPFSIRRLTKAQLLTLILVILVAVAGLAWSKSATLKNTPLAYSPTPANQTTKPNERLEVERATVRVKGFEPAAISRPKKSPFFLIIENRTGLRELSFQINNETGSKVNDKDLKSPKGKMSWNGVVDLPPGNYRLTELNHKEWALAITIENN